MANRPRTPSSFVVKQEKGKGNTKKKKKKTNPTKSSSSRSSKGKGKGIHGLISFLKSEKIHAITGVFLLLFTVFLLCSFVSFCFTHEADDNIFKPSFWDTINTEETPMNKLGIMGLYFSFLFIKHWFGLASFGFLLLGSIYGVYLLFKKALLPIFQTTVMVGAVMIWVSMLLAFIVPEQVWIGGGLGSMFQEYLTIRFGKAGFVLLLLFLAFMLSIIFGGTTFYKKWVSGLSRQQSEPATQTNDDYPFFQEDEQSDLSQSVPKVSIFARLFAFRKKKRLAFAADVDAGQSQDEQTGWSPDDDLFEEEQSFLVPSETSLGQNTIPGEDILIDEYQEQEMPVFAETQTEYEQETGSSEAETDSYQENIDDAQETEYSKLEPYDPTADLSHFRFPETELLENYSTAMRTREQKETEITANKLRIKETLGNYNITIERISAIEGPTITLYEIVPSPGIRISRIKGLEDDIALSLAALGIRIIAPMPGKGTIGIEVPNAVPQIVPMKSVIMSDKFQNAHNMALPIAIGKTISNEAFVFDLAKMPHVLMAGATGQGKSVGLNAILASLLYKKHPSELKFILVDPKKVELTLYSKIERHYLAKLPDAGEAIITDTKKVVKTLNSLCIEMDQRYELLKEAQCRNIIEYNEKFKARKLNPEHGHRFLPYIVLVFDEFADCIMTAGREVETPIARLAQLARAIGIHLVIATQRPSVNVITGLIKANFPARIAFRVSSKIDSRTILDASGAENLIGKGDMLILTGSGVTRVQCALVDTPEIERICDYIGEQHGYTNALFLPEVEDEASDAVQEADDGEFDPCFADAAREVVSKQQGSTSFLQRKFKLGYNRAGRIMDQLEREKIVGPSIGSKTRDVLIKDVQVLEEFLRVNDLA
ncbi:MAG: DNA translocase FtsK [Bacteroidales bacterium]|jgi:S-DNA-T family DNA segregation ATPase FtsK/SpoIIIE|nr:DNA translocase FtsK [Bacteroidales bacterium]